MSRTLMIVVLLVVGCSRGADEPSVQAKCQQECESGDCTNAALFCPNSADLCLNLGGLASEVVWSDGVKFSGVPPRCYQRCTTVDDCATGTECVPFGDPYGGPQAFACLQPCLGPGPENCPPMMRCLSDANSPGNGWCVSGCASDDDCALAGDFGEHFRCDLSVNVVMDLSLEDLTSGNLKFEKEDLFGECVEVQS